jgi:entericidin B
MRQVVLLMIVAASALSIAACNTVKGAGQDVSSAGHAVAQTAEDAKH